MLRGAESLMAAGRIRLVYLELIFSEMYEGLPPFDLVYRFLVDRNFGLVALYNYHYSGRPHGAAGRCSPFTASSPPDECRFPVELRQEP